MNDLESLLIEHRIILSPIDDGWGARQAARYGKKATGSTPSEAVRNLLEKLK